MTLGKTERMIAVIAVIAGLAAAVHFLIFAKKAENYNSATREFADAQTKLSSAEFIEDQAAFDAFKAQTTQYSGMVTTVVSELNLQKTDLVTSPPVGALDQWASNTIQLLTQLNSVRNGRVKLTFLDQTGWNLTPQLPGSGPVAERISRLNDSFTPLSFAVEPMAQAQVRASYNSNLEAIGVPPQETSNFLYPQFRLFFNDIGWLEKVTRQPGGGGLGNSNNGYAAYYNPYSLQRFGPAVPALKKIWVYTLALQQLQREGGASAINPNDLLRFGEALEIGIPLDGPEPRNSINKQLKALLDFIDIAGRSGVTEITSVKLLKPVNIGKATLFVPGATPPPMATPAATPNMAMDPMMGMMDPMMMDMGVGMATPATAVVYVGDAEKVGTGAGVELELKGDNASLARFFYELSHLTRTYGIDDLYYFPDPQGGLKTTSTIEVITDVKLGDGAAAAPVEGAPVQ